MSKKLSVHVPQKQLPKNDHERGSYIAGLIDAQGHLNDQGQYIISFDSRDVSHAYKVKSWIGYGSVRQIKEKNQLILVIHGKKAFERLWFLLNGKLRVQDRIQEWNFRIREMYKLPYDLMPSSFPIDWNSYWFPGFFSGYGRFVLEIFGKDEIRLKIKVHQCTRILLDEICKRFGGRVLERQDTYVFDSVSFQNFKEVLVFFDKHHLQSPLHYLLYRLMRKAAILIESKQANTHQGFAKIQSLQKVIGPLARKTK